nr:hypothetical protein [Marispirochaeta sp.]
MLKNSSRVSARKLRKMVKNPCTEWEDDLHKKQIAYPEFVDFYLPFGGRLCADNRWVQISKIIPWRDRTAVREIVFQEKMTPSEERSGCFGWRLSGRPHFYRKSDGVFPQTPWPWDNEDRNPLNSREKNKEKPDNLYRSKKSSSVN